MTDVRVTHIGGPTLLIEVDGWQLLTDPTFDAPGRTYRFGWGTASRKLTGPALPAESLGDLDAVLLTHDHHADNLDDAGRVLLPTAGRVVTTVAGSRRLGAGTIGLAPWQHTTLTAPGRPTIELSRPVVGEVTGFVLRWAGQRHGPLWITGDTVLYDGVRQVADRFGIGTVVLHLGAVRFGRTGALRYTMTAAEGAELCRLVAPIRCCRCTTRAGVTSARAGRLSRPPSPPPRPRSGEPALAHPRHGQLPHGLTGPGWRWNLPPPPGRALPDGCVRSGPSWIWAYPDGSLRCSERPSRTRRTGRTAIVSNPARRSPSESPTAKQRRVWDRSAPSYDRQIAFLERVQFAGGREWLGDRVRGRVLEVAIGTGRNLPYYPADATLTGVELSPAMLDIARRRAAELGRAVDLREGDAERLPFASASFDTVVCALSLCSIPHPAQAIDEMKRVLVPGGRLLLLDHVASTWPPVRAAQWLLERVTVRVAGEYFTRRQLPLVRAAGFTIVEAERLKAGTVERVHAVKSA